MHAELHWLTIAARSSVVYIALLAALRLAGKRHAGQLSPHDLVSMLLVANAVQGAMTGQDTSLLGGLVAACSLIALNVLITRLLLRHRRWGPLLAARPTLLIYNGVVIQERLDHEGLLREELEAQIRGHGFGDLTRVRFAVHESDGSISVIGFEPLPERRLPPPRTL